MIRKKTIILLLLLIVWHNVYPQPSDMIFIEQIYRLYENNLHRSQLDHRRNIFWLENCLNLPNIHPSQALVITNTWEEYVKYKKLLRFHIHFLLTKEYVDWGWQYDKRDVVFYNMEWAEELKESFEMAKSRYELARHYWEETKKWSDYAYSDRVHIGWEQIESLNYLIQTGQFEYDYGDIIDMRLAGIERKLNRIQEFMRNQTTN